MHAAISTAVKTRWADRGDMPEVMHIERLNHVHPWSELEFTRLMRHRQYILKIIEGDNRILGYHLYKIGRDYFAIIRLAIHPTYHRMGLGRRMVGDMQRRCGEVKRRSRIVADVHERRVGAQLFLRSCDMVCTGVLSGCYVDPDEKDYRFEWRV